MCRVVCKISENSVSFPRFNSCVPFPDSPGRPCISCFGHHLPPLIISFYVHSWLLKTIWRLFVNLFKFESSKAKLLFIMLSFLQITLYEERVFVRYRNILAKKPQDLPDCTPTDAIHFVCFLEYERPLKERIYFILIKNHGRELLSYLHQDASYVLLACKRSDTL